MFVCSRCGSRYNARHVGVENCPRCQLRDKVAAPLAFKAFDLSALNVDGRGAQPQGKGSGAAGSSTNTSTAMPSSVT